LRQTTKINTDLELFGNYFLVRKLIPSHPIVVSLGIGEDTRFDEALVANYDTDLYMYDPTPRSGRYISSRTQLKNAKFQEIAISDFDGTIEVYIDDLEGGLETTTSVTVMQPKGSDSSHLVPCKSLITIIEEEKLAHIDILKIDIEGGGLIVLKHLLEHNIFPVQICGEFERPNDKKELNNFFSEIEGLIGILKSKGYRIFRTREVDIGFQIEITAARY